MTTISHEPGRITRQPQIDLENLIEEGLADNWELFSHNFSRYELGGSYFQDHWLIFRKEVNY